MDISYIVEIITGIFAFIMGLIPMIVILFILVRVAKASKNQSGRGNVQGDPKAWLASRQKRLVKRLENSNSGEYTAPQQEHLTLDKGARNSNLAETFMKDDRQHDWLARQIKEEEKILRRGDRLDLGASHAASCDADMLKKYHLFAEHDDSVDSGEY